MKTVYRTSAIIAAVVLMFTLASGALFAQPSDGVVKVEGCGASQAHTQLLFMNPFGEQVAQPGTPAMVMIAYANASAKPISSIDFAVVQDGKAVAVVRDVGMFAPNAIVMHAYGIDPNKVPPPNQMVSCVPLMATYADGTKWVNPVMPSH